jgi:hypothetical protein
VGCALGTTAVAGECPAKRVATARARNSGDALKDVTDKIIAMTDP